MDLIVDKVLAADKRISATAKLLLAQLLWHRNRRTGRCDPWITTLAGEIGVSRWTVMRRLTELEDAGLITIKRTQRGNKYEFPKLQSATSQVAESHSAESQSATWGPPYPLYEPFEGKKRASRARSAPPPPHFSNPPDAAALVPGAPRKDMGRELNPYEMYVAAITDSVQNRGRFLSAAENSQIGTLMGLQLLRQRRAANGDD